MTSAPLAPKTILGKRDLLVNQIQSAAKISNRSVQSITLVAVSKVQPNERIIEILKIGQTVFGENRVQEAQIRWGETFQSERKNIELRLIGPLQSNKTADACALFDVIETLDREKLAKELAKIRDNGQVLPRLFVQVNTGSEPQKAGIAPTALKGFLKTCRETYGLFPEGLMCIPPIGEAASPHFWMLNNLARENNIEKLSMGMSGDFETAIKMGATHIRVGTAIFGTRN